MLDIRRILSRNSTTEFKLSLREILAAVFRATDQAGADGIKTTRAEGLSPVAKSERQNQKGEQALS
jgi:hypothetical protein